MDQKPSFWNQKFNFKQIGWENCLKMKHVHRMIKQRMQWKKKKSTFFYSLFVVSPWISSYDRHLFKTIIGPTGWNWLCILVSRQTLFLDSYPTTAPLCLKLNTSKLSKQLRVKNPIKDTSYHDWQNIYSKTILRLSKAFNFFKNQWLLFVKSYFTKNNYR